MADLCFLVQHYELAYSCYHTAKKDFLSDQAMLYAAGALVRTHTQKGRARCGTHTHTLVEILINKKRQGQSLIRILIYSQLIYNAA
jgi:hypothetical protein